MSSGLTPALPCLCLALRILPTLCLVLPYPRGLSRTLFGCAGGRQRLWTSQWSKGSQPQKAATEQQCLKELTCRARRMSETGVEGRAKRDWGQGRGPCSG